MLKYSQKSKRQEENLWAKMNLRFEFIRSYPYTWSEVLLQLRLEGHFEHFGFDVQ